MIARLRSWWRRMRLAWVLSRDADLSLLVYLARLRRSEVYEAACWAVHKNQMDLQLVSAAKNEHLRIEAIQWATAYLRERGLTAHPWVLRLCVELAVGAEKRYLRDEVA